MTAKTKTKWNRGIFIVGMLLIPVAHFAVFWLGVNTKSILMAFQNEKLGEVYWTLNNFKTLYLEFFGSGNSNMLVYVKNTLLFFGLNLFVVTPVSILLSYFLYKRIAGYKFFRVMFYMPSILTAVVLAAMYKYMLGVSGPVTAVYKMLTGASYGPAFLMETRYALKCLVIYTLWTGFAGNFILYGGAMNRIPVDVVESGRIEGVTMPREVWNIVIPMIWPTISTTLIFAVVGMFSAGGANLLLTPTVQSTYTLSYYIFDQVKRFNLFYVPAALGLVFTLIGFPIVMGFRALINRVYDDVEY